MNPRSKPISLPIPEKGVHQGIRLTAQPPGTCTDARNMRTSTLQDRVGIGKRGGLIKAVSQAAGIASAPQVNGLAFLSKARGAPASALGALTAVTDTFASYPIAAIADIGDDFNTCAWNAPTFFASSNGYTGITLLYNGNETVAATALSSHLKLDYQFTGFNSQGIGQPVMNMVSFHTNNDVTLYVETLNTCPFPADGVGRWGAVGTAWGVGPCILSNIGASSYIIARLKPTALNTFVLEIVQVFSATLTAPAVLVSSTSPLMPGAITMGVTAGSSVYSIRLRETAAGTVEATLNWSAQSVSGHTISVARPALVLGNTRSGFGILTDASIGGTSVVGGANVNYRTINQFLYSKYVPNPYTAFLTANGSTPSPTANNFYVPDQWRAVGWYTGLSPGGGGVNVQDGQFTSASTPATLNFPMVDDADNRIEPPLETARAGFLVTTAPTEKRGVDMTVSPNQTNPAAGVQPHFGCIFRVGDNSQDGVGLLISPDPSTDTAATGCILLNLAREVQMSVSGGNVTATTTDFISGALSNTNLIVRENARFRCVESADGTSIDIYVNGVRILSRIPSSANWASLAANNRCGALMLGNATVFPGLLDVRIVEGNASASVNLAEVDPKVAVFTTNTVQVADLQNNTLVTCTGSLVLPGSMPEAASFNNKFYCVDGTSVGGVIVDPVALTVADWVATAGTAPWDDVSIGFPRLVCTYRGRLVTARFSLNPSLWVATRVFVPTDFAYGAAPVSTSAVVGSNSDVGQPGDVITALMPFSDDYLYFGCASSIWMLEGDPGYGGAVQAISYKTGVVGPRAFCFDEQGDLYFMGGTGLFRMARGSMNPEPVMPSVLPILDRIDSSQTLVQLAYDSWKRYVHIFLTPVNGTTAGVHVVFDVPNQALWLDEYNRTYDPFAVCEINGVEDEDRRWLIGASDGYIRRPSDGTNNDDGTTVPAWVRLVPIESEDAITENVLSESQFTLGDSSASVDWYWLTGHSANEVNNIALTNGVPASFAQAGTLASAGFQTPIRHRLRGAAHQLLLRQSLAAGTFSVERALARMAVAGRRR